MWTFSNISFIFLQFRVENNNQRSQPVDSWKLKLSIYAWINFSSCDWLPKSESSCASTLSWLYHSQNSSLLKWEKRLFTGNNLATPYTHWKETRHRRTEGLGFPGFRILLPALADGGGWWSRGYRRYTLPHLYHRHTCWPKSSSFTNPALNPEIWALFLCSYFAGVFLRMEKYQCRSTILR